MMANAEGRIDEGTCLLSTNPQDDKLDILRRTRVWLYTSHLFAQFADGLWQFCLVLFLAAFSNYKSLMLVSTYGLVSGLTVCLLGSKAGRFVDAENRLYAARVFIFAENACVLLATILCYSLLSRDTETLIAQHGLSVEDNPVIASGIKEWIRLRLYGVPTDPLSITLIVGIHVLGASAMILSQGFLIAIERDWVVVMSCLAASNDGKQGINSSENIWRSETNVVMKQIDLACKIGAPAVAGFVIAAFDNDSNDFGRGMRGAAILVGIINCLALTVEYICTLKIYNLIPELRVKAHEMALSQNGLNSEKPVEDAKVQDTVGNCGFFQLPHGLSIYLSDPMAAGGIAYALLYLNVLSFGGIMTAYMVWRGMRFDSVGVWRGISSAIGLLGTFVYHWSVRNMSLESTGMWSITFQFIWLSLSYASLFVADMNVSLAMLVCGVCASRIGLWVFDISITQLMQEYVPAPIRGVTGGVQKSLNSFFTLLSFALGIVFPNPSTFHVYVSLGYSSVGIAMVLYAFGVYMKQDKLRSV